MRKDGNEIEFSMGGVYTLLLFLQKETTVTIGSLGKHKFTRGYYTYTGSALGKGATRLKHRLARHLRKEKTKFWHIDYLLANQNVSIEAVVVAQTKEKMECNLNNYIKNIKGAKVQVKGFGASDCKKGCGTHLLHFPEETKTEMLVQKIADYLGSVADVVSVEVVC